MFLEIVKGTNSGAVLNMPYQMAEEILKNGMVKEITEAEFRQIKGLRPRKKELKKDLPNKGLNLELTTKGRGRPKK